LDEDVFLHHSALQNNSGIRIFAGDRVTFTVKSQKKGLAAKNAKRVVEKDSIYQGKKLENISFSDLAPSNFKEKQE
jgi:hypothetical protein